MDFDSLSSESQLACRYARAIAKNGAEPLFARDFYERALAELADLRCNAGSSKLDRANAAKEVLATPLGNALYLASTLAPEPSPEPPRDLERKPTAVQKLVTDSEYDDYLASTAE